MLDLEARFDRFYLFGVKSERQEKIVVRLWLGYKEAGNSKIFNWFTH
jgi:hypothetical protein